jgi:hypothetical protein
MIFHLQCPVDCDNVSAPSYVMGASQVGVIFQ